MSGDRQPPNGQPLVVSVSRHLGVPLINLAGELDSATVKHLHQAVDDALLDEAHILLLDMSRVEYIDSAGLNVLFDATRTVMDIGWVGAVAPNPVVRKLLEMAGLIHQRCFRVFEDLDAVTLD